MIEQYFLIGLLNILISQETISTWRTFEIFDPEYVKKGLSS